jgi:hypothetical protein
LTASLRKGIPFLTQTIMDILFLFNDLFTLKD